MQRRSRIVPRPGQRLGLPTAEVVRRLEALVATYDRRFLHSDPVGVVRRFDAPADREIAGLLAAGLAYGRVASIRASLDRALAALGPSPSAAVDTLDPLDVAGRLEGFVHRFNDGRDVALLLSLVRQARRRSGSLEAFFLEGDADPSSGDLGPAMSEFTRRLFSLDARPFFDGGKAPWDAGARRLLTSPASGSVCKRHCLFLRWMVRPDDGIDCGVWKAVSPARLVLPLDTHLIRVAATLGWTRRRSPCWAMALEVTAQLRELDAADPTRFDFALSRLGILGRIRARGGTLRLREVARVLSETAEAAAEAR